MSEQAPSRPEAPPMAARIHVLALRPPRAENYRRINERAEAHFRLGLVEEVRELLARGLSPEAPALGAHGYRRVVEYLEGKRTLESAIEQTKLDVRRYSKRQLTWLRREPGVEWFEGSGSDPRVEEQVGVRVSELLNVG